MTNTKSSLDYWRKIFSCAKADIFELIEKAILVAAADYPNEFNDKKDLILEKLHNPQLSHNAVETQIVAEVMRIKEILFNNQNESDSILYDSLRSLQLMNLSVETLKATEIGRSVNALRKHKSKQIQKLAQTLVNGWKELVDESVESTAEITNNSADSANELNELSISDFGMKRKPSNNPQNNSGQSNEISEMSKLEMTERKLIEGYQRIQQAKKQRMVKMIDLRDLPMDSIEKRRPKKKP